MTFCDVEASGGEMSFIAVQSVKIFHLSTFWVDKEHSDFKVHLQKKMILTEVKYIY